MDNDARRQLDERGFVLLEDAMGADLLQGLRRRIGELFAAEGDGAGKEFKT